MRDIAAPESIRALQHFPACSVIVGQSIINATVTYSCIGSPPCSWESLRGEGSFSLNDLLPLLSHWNSHYNCNSPCVDFLFSLADSSSCVGGLMTCWSMSVIYAKLALRICRLDVNVIYYDLWSGRLRNFYVWMIFNEFGVLCCGRINDHNLYMWNVSIMSYSWGGCDYPYVMTWSSLCMSHDDLSCDACDDETVIWNDFACPYLHGGVLNLI